MKKYLQVMKNTWDEASAYRASFIIYRLRFVLGILTMYFLWLVVLPEGETVFGYDQSTMLTYVLGVSLMTSIVFATKSQSIATDINEGNLSNFLLRPVSFLKYQFARDIADKGVNIVFAIFELTLLFVILKPPFYIQTDPVYLTLFVISTLFATLMYFFFSVLLGMVGFWSNETWGPRFIFYQLIIFFAGGLFPLDMLPSAVYQSLEYLPFQYLIYFPLNIYLGQVGVNEAVKGIAISGAWIVLMLFLTKYLWGLGLKFYTAHGK